MHVLDANELFWITSYTYDRIMEVWWKQWPDAFALYFKLMKQARIQQTNQTYSSNSFLKDGMWWWTDRLRKAKNILKNLWLVDDVNIQDKKWKIIGHYVRVNYLIDEEKVRTAGMTYNLSTCWLWPQMDENHLWTPSTCGWTATNALSTKYINAWSTKIENNCLSKNKTTTSSKKKELTAEQTEAFERVWKEYPQKTHKKDARKHFLECDYDELMFDAKQKKRMVELEVIEKQYVKWWWRWMEEFSPQSNSQKLQDMRRIFEKHMEIWWEDMRERMERMKDDFPDVDFKKLASDYNEKNKIKFNFTP